MGSFNEADSLHAYKSKLHACPPLDRETERWAAASHRHEILEIGWQVERFAAVSTPEATAAWR